jgi:hypothetical protein
MVVRLFELRTKVIMEGYLLSMYVPLRGQSGAQNASCRNSCLSTKWAIGKHFYIRKTQQMGEVS